MTTHLATLHSVIASGLKLHHEQLQLDTCQNNCQNPHCPRLEVSDGASTSWGVGNGSLKVDDADSVYWGAKGKGVTVLNHKPTEVLRLNTSNPVASCKPDTQSLHQKLAAGY